MQLYPANINIYLKAKLNMNHDLDHCNAVVSLGIICPKCDQCERYIAHVDAVKHKLVYIHYLSAYCCVQSPVSASDHIYDKIPYNGFREIHE